jgi:AGZA family xanthine/uracil permease-like MFS transporter
MIARYFRLQELHTTVRQEVIGGVTTFVTMAYIIVVNPKILEAAGIPFGPSMVATILTAFLGTLLMGVYARRPFAVAPYMGENAFVAFTVVKVLGYTWQTAIGAIFISGLLFAVLTLLNIRTWLVNSIPEKLKIAFSAGIGLFLTFIGLNETGIIAVGVPGAPVHVGNFATPPVALAIFGFILTSFLMIKKIKGAIFLGVLSVTLLALLTGMTAPPSSLLSMPPSPLPIFAKLDIAGALKFNAFPVILTMLVMIFVDTMGTLIGVSYKAGFLDGDGNLPEIEKPMLCDSLSTMAGAVLGTTTSGAYIESAAGIEAGGRSGLSSVVTAVLFLSALFFAPLFAAVPPYAFLYPETRLRRPYRSDTRLYHNNPDELHL